METVILIKGIVASVSIREFEKKKSFVYQFLTDTKSGALSLINVKSDVTLGYEKDDEVEIPISISCYNDSIYYKAL